MLKNWIISRCQESVSQDRRIPVRLSLLLAGPPRRQGRRARSIGRSSSPPPVPITDGPGKNSRRRAADSSPLQCGINDEIIIGGFPAALRYKSHYQPASSQDQTQVLRLQHSIFKRANARSATTLSVALPPSCAGRLPRKVGPGDP